jgi:hypothetical protein
MLHVYVMDLDGLVENKPIQRILSADFREYADASGGQGSRLRAARATYIAEAA